MLRLGFHPGTVPLRRKSTGLRIIQQMLGHEDLKTTQVYTQVAIRALQQIHAATHPAGMPSSASSSEAKPGS